MDDNYFLKRVTVRDFKDEKVSQKTIEQIVEKGMRAPTCGNMQLYSVIVTRDKDNKRILSEQHFNQPAAVSADVILTVCADFNRFVRWCRLRNATPGYNNFHSFMMACTDAIIFAQQMVAAAESEGLGTCYLGTVNYNADKISELLHLPELVVPVAALAIGIPASRPDQPERLPIKGIVFEEKYPELSDEELLGIFEEKEKHPENIRYVKENNKETLAQLFTDIRYTQPVNEAASEMFLKLLRDKKFNF